MQSLWLIPSLPAVAALANLSLSGEGRVARRWSPRLASGLTAIALLVSGALSGRAVLAQQPLGPGAERVDVLGDWIPKLPVATRDAMGILEVPWGLRLDPKSTMLLVAVLACAALAYVYASMTVDRERRTQSVQMLSHLGSSGSFLVLVALGSSLPVVFAGWAGVVATSALLGIPSDIPSATRADRRAGSLLALPIGFTAFMLAIGLTFLTFGALDVRAVERATATTVATPAPWGAASTPSLLIVIGVVTAGGAFVSRSAGLAAWLPIAAGVGVLWQTSAITSRAPVAAGAGVAIGALTVMLIRRREALP